MPSVAEFLVKRVKAYGWFSVGNLYVDNCYSMNPFTIDGRICLSESAELIITLGNYDATTSAILENYLVHDRVYVGYQQTVGIFGFEHLQHFDINLFNQTRVYPPIIDGDFPLPNIPTPSIINAFTVDPETNLVDGQSVGMRLDGTKIATYDMFPNLNISDTFGARIPDLQQFYKNQKQFADTMNEFLGLTDCI